MKKYFITGLAILLPAVLTAMIFVFIINLLTKPFVGIIEDILRHYHVFSSRQLITLVSKLVIMTLLFAITFLIGFLARILIFHYLFRLGNYILHRIPLINKIYKAIQDVITTIFHENSSKFSEVVLIPFPTEDSLCLGLITNDPITKQPKEDAYGNISVFVPATPNPTIGFVLLYRREQMVALDMTVEEAIKFVVSCGVMSSGFTLKNALPK